MIGRKKKNKSWQNESMEKNKYKIKNLPKADRPWGKLIQESAQNLKKERKPIE